VFEGHLSGGFVEGVVRLGVCLVLGDAQWGGVRGLNSGTYVTVEYWCFYERERPIRPLFGSNDGHIVLVGRVAPGSLVSGSSEDNVLPFFFCSCFVGTLVRISKMGGNPPPLSKSRP